MLKYPKLPFIKTWYVIKNAKGSATKNAIITLKIVQFSKMVNVIYVPALSVITFMLNLNITP